MRRLCLRVLRCIGCPKLRTFFIWVPVVCVLWWSLNLPTLHLFSKRSAQVQLVADATGEDLPKRMMSLVSAAVFAGFILPVGHSDASNNMDNHVSMQVYWRNSHGNSIGHAEFDDLFQLPAADLLPSTRPDQRLRRIPIKVQRPSDLGTWFARWSHYWHNFWLNRRMTYMLRLQLNQTFPATHSSQFYYDYDWQCDKLDTVQSKTRGYFVHHPYLWMSSDEYWAPIWKRNPYTRSMLQYSIPDGQLFIHYARQLFQPQPLVWEIVDSVERQYRFWTRKDVISIGFAIANETLDLDPYIECLVSAIQSKSTLSKSFFFYIIPKTQEQFELLSKKIHAHMKDATIISPQSLFPHPCSLQEIHLIGSHECARQQIAEMMVLSEVDILFQSSHSTLAMASVAFRNLLYHQHYPTASTLLRPTQKSWVVYENNDAAFDAMIGVDKKLDGVCGMLTSSEPVYQTRFDVEHKDACVAQGVNVPSLGERIME